jgi:acyl-coenzyme A thioesterase PaaI-like protein
MHHLTGTVFEEARQGEATFSMPVTGWLRSSQGAVPGGLLAVPGDGALGCAIHTELAAGLAYRSPAHCRRRRCIISSASQRSRSTTAQPSA